MWSGGFFGAVLIFFIGGFGLFLILASAFCSAALAQDKGRARFEGFLIGALLGPLGLLLVLMLPGLKTPQGEELPREPQWWKDLGKEVDQAP